MYEEKMGDGKKVGETSSGEVVNGFWSCRDLTDVVPLHTPRGLYLKPIAKINVSVNLPQLKTPGKTISTWEVMEKIRTLIVPDEFASLKVAKSTLEFIRLEGDLSDRCRLQRVLARLESQRLNLAGFPNVLKVRVAEAKDEFPNRHSWDSYFRDAKHMNELKPGERPDTIHITGLPVKWFSEDGGSTPSESVVTKVFKKWGPLRRVDVPAADVYRPRMRLGNNIQKFSFGDGIFFEAYIQYIEYMDFVKAMDALRGMKLLKKESKSCLTAMIKVDFDKSKHMSDSTVSHREFERKRLIAQDSLAAEKMRRKEEVEAQRKEETKKKEAADIAAKEQRRKLREEKRKRKALRVFRKQEEDKVSMKIAREEQKLIKAQRQLESIRLLDELFDRIKIKVEKKEIVIGDKDTAPKPGEKKPDGQETIKPGEKDGDKKGDKKNKKLKKKKTKKDKKKKKKRKKGKASGSGSSSEDSAAETGKKKMKSVLTVNNAQPSSSAGSAPIDQSLNFPPMYPRFPQAWYYEAALPMLYPAMGRGGPRGGPMNRFPRGRGRGFSARRGGVPRSMRNFNPHIYNEQYYKYFANLAGQEYPDYESDYDSRRGSKSRSRSRGRSKPRSRSRGRSKSRSRTRGRSKSRSRSRGRSRSRSRSGRRSRRRRSSRSRSRSKSRSRSRSRSRRRGDRSSSRSRSRSRTRSRDRRSRSKSRTRSKSRSRNVSKTRNNRRKRSRSKVKVTRARSRSISTKRRSHSSSWSMPKSPRQRSCSWSKTADEKKDDSSGKIAAVAEKSDAAVAAKEVAPSAQTEVITPD